MKAELGISNRSKHIRHSIPVSSREHVETRNRAVLRLVHLALREPDLRKPEKRILDLASGRGELLRMLAQEGYRVTGLDLDPTCVRMGQQHAQCVQGDALSVDAVFGRNTFDLVVCSHFLEHTENPKSVVEKIKRVSKRYLLLVVPNLAQFITLRFRAPEYVIPGHLYGWDPSHFKTFLELHCGLRIVHWECDQVIMPARSLWRRTSVTRKIVRYLEERLLPKVFPYMSNSLVVLCEVTEDRPIAKTLGA